MASLSTWGNTLIGQDDYVNRAANQARAQYDAGLDAVKRQAGRMGINPSSGAFMNMLNQAQYERTAGTNAAANDANYQWLNAAQKQFNADRDFGLSQQRLNDANNQWWAKFGLDRDSETARYANEEGKYNQAVKERNRLLEEWEKNNNSDDWRKESVQDMKELAELTERRQNAAIRANLLRMMQQNRYRNRDYVDITPYLDEPPGYWHPYNMSWTGGR